MAWVHNLDPFALQMTESFGVRWYSLAYLLGFLLGYWAIVFMTARSRTGFEKKDIGDFITYVAIGVIVGGRLGYCLFYAPDLFFSFDASFPYWGVLKLHEGGMASHGGILGVMLVCWFYGKRHKIPPKLCLDLTVFGGSLGFMFGRLANFINGELYGREAPESLPWAVKFPQEMTQWPRDGQYLEKLSNLGPALEAMGKISSRAGETMSVNAETWQRWIDQKQSDYSSRMNIDIGIDSLIAAVQGGNHKVADLLQPILTARHPSQIYQLFLEGLFVFLILVWLWRKPQKAGIIGGWFGVLYCVARIIGEQFRMPDAHIGFEALGLTRGQLISIAMLVFAAVYLILAYRSKGEKWGGWQRD